MDKVITVKENFAGLDGLSFSMRYSERNIDITASTAEGLHIHDCYEIYINVEGKVSFVVEDTVYNISAGDIIITRPNEFHYCLFEKNILHKCYCLWLFPSKETALEDILKNKTSTRNNLMPSSSGNNSYRFNLFSELCNNENSNLIHKLSVLMQILDIVSNSVEASIGSAKPFPENIQKIIDYINENFNTITSLDEIYSKFYVSSSTLNRYFYKHLKTTPSKYIENKRMANARSILSHGGSVMQAAFQSGFPDYSHFIKLFKEKFGVTPGKYYKIN